MMYRYMNSSTSRRYVSPSRRSRITPALNGARAAATSATAVAAAKPAGRTKRVFDFLTWRAWPAGTHRDAA